MRRRNSSPSAAAVEPLDTEKKVEESKQEDGTKVGFLLEPLILLLFLAQFLSNQILTSHITFRVCHYYLNESDATCAQLEEPGDDVTLRALETKTQPFVANFLTGKNTVESLIPAIVSLFVGAWSDKNGRRMIIMIAYAGYLIQFFLFFCLGSIPFAISPQIYWLPSLIVGLTGGNCILMTMFMSYLSDVFSPTDLPARMGRFQMALIGGLLMGSVLSSVLSKSLGTVNVFLVSTLVLGVGVLWIKLGVPESIKLTHKPTLRLSEVFQMDMIKDLMHSVVRVRPNYDRFIVWSTICLFTSMNFMQEGQNVVFFLFLREKYGMRASDFAIFFVTFTVIIVVGAKVGFVVQKALNLDDSSGICMANLVLGLNSYLGTISTKVWHLYAGMFFGLFRFLPDALSRKILSDVAGSDEMGKLNSFIGTFQALMGILAAPLYSYVYKSTLETAPETFMWINFVIFIGNAGLFWIVGKFVTKDRTSDDTKED